MKRYPFVIPTFCLLVALAAAAAAQTTFASVTGTVTDSSGAAVTGAIITAVHRDSNYRYTATSNAAGAYTLAQLREGVDTVRAKTAAFKEFVATEVQLVSLDVRRIDIQLEVGAVDTRIEVTAGATLIETETARISGFQVLPTACQSAAEHSLTVEFRRPFPGRRAGWQRFFHAPLCRLARKSV
jgi:hypothetical protein